VLLAFGCDPRSAHGGSSTPKTAPRVERVRMRPHSCFDACASPARSAASRGIKLQAGGGSPFAAGKLDAAACQALVVPVHKHRTSSPAAVIADRTVAHP
jgi:hypothetical protein